MGRAKVVLCLQIARTEKRGWKGCEAQGSRGVEARGEPTPAPVVTASTWLSYPSNSVVRPPTTVSWSTGQPLVR
jgi:hypothetical protein